MAELKSPEILSPRKSRGSTDSASWLRKVSDTQTAKMTPEVRVAMLEKAERSRQILAMQVESAVYQKRSNAAFRGCSNVLKESAMMSSASPALPMSAPSLGRARDTAQMAMDGALTVDRRVGFAAAGAPPAAPGAAYMEGYMEDAARQELFDAMAAPEREAVWDSMSARVGRSTQSLRKAESRRAPPSSASASASSAMCTPRMTPVMRAMHAAPMKNKAAAAPPLPGGVAAIEVPAAAAAVAVAEEAEAAKDYDSADDEDVADVLEIQQQLQLMQQQVMLGEIAAATPLVQAEAVADAQDFNTLLQQLRIEPADGAELRAKFSIFETYLDTVVALREQVFDLWGRGKTQMLAAGVSTATMDRDIAKIDGNENIGLDDAPAAEWLVYGMMLKASKNHAALSSVLRSIETKLGLLAREDCECPMCLESLTSIVEDGGAVKILSCCHKVCGDCWLHWTTLKAQQHANAYCPICQNVEFVADLHVMIAAPELHAPVGRQHPPRLPLPIPHLHAPAAGIEHEIAPGAI